MQQPTTAAEQARPLLQIDPAQITRLTWREITQPNYGGNTFKARAQVTADHIRGGIAKLEDYKCFTFNGSHDITAEFQAEVTRIIEVKAKAQVITELIKTIGEILQEGPTPAGTLYAGLMQYGLTLPAFTEIIDAFKKAGKVKEKLNTLYWIA